MKRLMVGGEEGGGGGGAGGRDEIGSIKYRQGWNISGLMTVSARERTGAINHTEQGGYDS